MVRPFCVKATTIFLPYLIFSFQHMFLKKCLLFCLGSWFSLANAQLLTPFELSGEKASSTYFEAMAHYRELAVNHAQVGLYQYGQTDAGFPLHLVVVSDSNVAPQSMAEDYIKQQRRKGKAVLLVMNGIHPGEPCGIDASMMWARDLVLKQNQLLEDVVVCIIPVYNIGGALNRSAHSRANQNGPSEYGFRGNAQNLDLNRDFIKADSRNTWAFWELYHQWQPDVFIDNHTTNGADHQYTMTLIASQKNKQNAGVASYMNKMVPMLYTSMAKKEDEMCPYVNVHGHSPDNGFTAFLETPRYSTGYTSLFGTVSFVAEAHMLKPFKKRVWSTYRLMETMLETMVATKEALLNRSLETVRQQARLEYWPVKWKLDSTSYSILPFKGYAYKSTNSSLTGGTRHYYDHDAPYIKEVKYYNTYKVSDSVDKPFAYIIPQGWHKVIDRLKANRCLVKRFTSDQEILLEYYRIKDYNTVNKPYEGHYLHNMVDAELDSAKIPVRKGDYIVILPNRFAIETLEPMAHDAFFRWNFFDAVLQQKEWFSAYVFEDIAAQWVKDHPEVLQDWQQELETHPEWKNNEWQMLYFIYKQTPYYERCRHMVVPVYRLQKVEYFPVED